MATPRHILVVDDERDIVDLLAFNLRRAGFEVSTAFSGRQALDAVFKRTPDLVILDVMLPEISGTDVARQIRTQPGTGHVPIIMLTAKGQETDQVVGLASGADDYITKPFSLKILTARIDALLRRTSQTDAGHGSLRRGPIRIDTDTHEVFVDGEPVKFTLTEFRILTSLIQAAGRVLSRASLMARAMGPGVTVTERTIDVHVTAIRKRLGPHAAMIRTVRGVGYRVSDEPAIAGESESGQP